MRRSGPSADSGARSATSISCLLCGGLRHRAIFEEFDVRICKCRECHHVFPSRVADPHFDGFWGEHVEEEPHAYWSEARDEMYRDFVRTFLSGRAGRLLDIGCGLGYFLRRVSATGSWEGYGSEISPAAVRYAREKLGIANIVCGRPADLELPEQSFDVITLWDVIDHLPAPDPVLQRCRALLRNGGLCFIRTPNVTTQLARARLTKLVRGMQPDLKVPAGRSSLPSLLDVEHHTAARAKRFCRRGVHTPPSRAGVKRVVHASSAELSVLMPSAALPL